MRTFIVKWEDEILEIVQDDDGLFIIPDVLRGIGTALKPATEHWILARKPIEGTVADNVLKYGVGGLNIDECRVGTSGGCKRVPGTGGYDAGAVNALGGHLNSCSSPPAENLGRWPANLILSHSEECTDEQCVEDCPIKMLDEQSGYTKSTSNPRNNGAFKSVARGADKACVSHGYDDSGGASRFFKTFNPESECSQFMYCPQASKKDRNSGGRIVEYKLKADAPQSVVEKIIKELNM